MLTLTGVTVRYGTREVIHGVDWTVGGDSPVTALLGPSGCGKSTLLRAIAGLEPVASGTLAVDGEALAGTPVHRRDFGVVFQDGQLFPGRTVSQNIAYGLARRGWSRARVRARVDEMLDLVQLPTLGPRRVTELSGGQAQRVALARALAPRPRLLLLDEPLAALDRRLRDELAVAIADIVRAEDIPTVVVTHDHDEAAAMADTVSVMNGGRIVASDPPARLWRRPADAWVADFLGATRTVPAVLDAGRLALPAGVLPIGDVPVGGVAEFADVPDGPCEVALRPDSLTAVPDPDASATVRRVTPLVGSWRLAVGFDRDGGGLEWEAAADVGVAVGDRVRLTAVPERLAILARPTAGGGVR